MISGLEEKVSCKPLIQSEIDSSVTSISALFSWRSLRNGFISSLVDKTKNPLPYNTQNSLTWA